MLTTKCIHPGIMKALSLCGHGSKVLIADGNYPLEEKSGNAEKIYLGLTPGLPRGIKSHSFRGGNRKSRSHGTWRRFHP